MSEQEPEMKLTFGENTYDSTPENTALFLHRLGETAIGDVLFDNSRFDHVWFTFEADEETGQVMGTHIWREHGEVFDALKDYIEEQPYPKYIDIIPSEVDKQAYLNYLEYIAQQEAGDVDDELRKLLGDIEPTQD